ncbi:adenylyl cyclase-associated protein 2 [Cricetulus griseus]|uniref:Adenylyl cyclase-associated protein 2 n=1 Tax=Cricetulus griseus TaxID=10029 RepID=A0A061ICH5_CRIGR|nr:adenylyl cyclase-associated protein 2 [Cricetulus griseus]
MARKRGRKAQGPAATQIRLSGYYDIERTYDRMADMLGLVERLECAVNRLEQLSAGPCGPPGDCGEVNGVNGGVAPSVEAFDKLVNSMVAEFLKKSRVLSGDVETHMPYAVIKYLS